MSDPTLPPNGPANPSQSSSQFSPPHTAAGTPAGGMFAAPLPGAIVTDSNARTWGMIGHLSAFATFLLPSVGNILGPLIVWLIKKDEIPFAGDQAKEALNFNITWSIVAVALSWTICIGIGFVLLPGIYIFILVMTIVAAMKANQGEYYRYPATIRFVK